MIAFTLIYRSSDPSGLLFWCALGFCFGIGLFAYGFRVLQRRRLILDTPFSKIRSASMGLVEISGLAVGPYTMIAPITTRPCYYYRTLVWEWKQSGKNKRWVKIAGECMHLPFFVDDNTGRLLVDPRGADLDLHRDFHQEFNHSFFSSSNDAPANVTNFLARHGIVTNNKVKVEEWCIKPKNSLFILGTLAENPGLAVTPTPAQDYEIIRSAGSISISVGSVSVTSGNAPTTNIDLVKLAHFLTGGRATVKTEVIRLTPENIPINVGHLAQPKKVADALRKAGIANPAAWAAAGVTMAGTDAPGVQVIEEPPTGVATTDPASHAIVNGFDPHPPVVLMKGENNKTFLISWRSQKEVARSLGWKCTLMIWGGPILALLSLYLFLSLEQLF